jgi:hypothetical protein
MINIVLHLFLDTAIIDEVDYPLIYSLNIDNIFDDFFL